MPKDCADYAMAEFHKERELQKEAELEEIRRKELEAAERKRRYNEKRRLKRRIERIESGDVLATELAKAEKECRERVEEELLSCRHRLEILNEGK